MKKMMIVFYILAVILSIVLIILIIGLLLPSEQVVSRKGHFQVTPHELYSIVTDNHNWQYRSGIKELVFIDNGNGLDMWEEISENGSSIRFKTIEKRPDSFYSFEMDAGMFTGYWTGEFEPDGKGGTFFTATEHIKIRNPFIKTLSYIFFDVGKFMDTYQNDLKKRVEATTEHLR